MGENLTKVALRGQVDAHSHVVEDNKGDERGCNLETEGGGGGVGRGEGKSAIQDCKKTESHQVMRMTTETSSKTGSPRLLRHASNNTLMRKRMESSLRVAEASAVTITMKAVGSLSERNAHKNREKQ
jgi:hypothetical protein